MYTRLRTRSTRWMGSSGRLRKAVTCARCALEKRPVPLMLASRRRSIAATLVTRVPGVPPLVGDCKNTMRQSSELLSHQYLQLQFTFKARTQPRIIGFQALFTVKIDIGAFTDTSFAHDSYWQDSRLDSWTRC